MNAPRWLAALLVVVALVTAGGWALRRSETNTLLEQRNLLREDQHRLQAAEAQRQKLQAAMPSDAELARLHEDDAATQRLRGELNRLRADIAAAEAKLR